MIHKTAPHDAAVHESGWVRIGDVEVTALPLVDLTHRLPDGTPLFARLTYEDALLVAAREGARLVRMAEVELVRKVGLQLMPYLGTPIAEKDIVHSERHDADIWRQLRAHQWDGAVPVCGAGKHWLDEAPAGKSRLGGWDKDGPGPGQAWWQRDTVAHNRKHHDDGTTTVLVRPARVGTAKRISSAILRAFTWLVGGLRPTADLAEKKGNVTMRQTIRLGSSGADVLAWQRIVGAKPDGAFGPGTEELTKTWQQSKGLVADGVAGPKSWAAAGEATAAPKAGAYPGDAPACRAALRDANARWPNRKRISDGIPGDLAHQARPSDHNLGNAVDITHDPASGCDGNVIAELAMKDARVSYIIWNAQIWNPTISPAWRPYKGKNAHRHHIHISVRADLRGDASPWPWAA